MCEMTREEFAAQFRGAVEGLYPDEVARVCCTSIAVVRRWYDGTSAPHHIARGTVLEAVEQLRNQ